MKRDNSLIRSLQTGVKSAEIEIVNKFNSRLFTYFRLRIKGEDCYEDLVQEVFVSFFNAVKKNKISGDEFIAPFVFGIAKRILYNFFYKKKRGENIRKKAEINHEPSVDFLGEYNLENEQIISVINKHIVKLKKVDKVIMKEFFFNESSIQEIAVLLNKPKHYISVRKERALKKIKNEMLKHENVFKE